ncbi:hypothetical protein V6N11_066177 [Hibiscus sabdariffa]|uniref:Reverse transcriptase zinc-binding domain-containing protein n=1 Tax=Hibiscus sabdariffa TaxID=183260 RepID=A0ABR2AGR8_9ROSI
MILLHLMAGIGHLSNACCSLKLYLLAQHLWNASDSRWKIICTLHVPERIRGFLWLALHNKLLSNIVRLQRHLTTDSTCFIFGFEDESLLDILWDFPPLNGLWSQILLSHPQAGFFNSSLGDWLIMNL